MARLRLHNFTISLDSNQGSLEALEKLDATLLHIHAAVTGAEI